jgi:hypothetical protein
MFENDIVQDTEKISEEIVRFEVFTVVTIKNAVFWDVAPCRYCVNRRFGETYRLHLQDIKIRERGTSVSRWLQTADPENGGDTFLRNVSLHNIYTAQYPRRQHSSVKISPVFLCNQMSYYHIHEISLGDPTHGPYPRNLFT